jgi:phenylpropionate dioxygenase-like ring-hydroxylating dioxygenase large terminal subunit
MNDLVPLDPITAAWHPAGWSADIGPGPHRVTLFGRDHVVFRDATGAPVTLPDACPHRGTSLALGAVVAGEVLCPYHGWAFDGRGRCTRIPSLGADAPIPEGAHTTSLPTVERDDRRPPDRR